MRNLIAKFPGSKDGIIVLGSHIDTNYPLRKTSFVGANDGGSSTALLLAIADQLRGKKLEGYSVWLAFFDGKSPFPPQRLVISAGATLTLCTAAVIWHKSGSRM